MTQITSNNSNLENGIFILFIYIPILIISVVYLSSWFVSFGMICKLILTYLACSVTFDAISSFLDYLFQSSSSTTVTIEETSTDKDETKTTE